MLLKRPGLTAVAALSLALGIGANTVIFSLINGTLLRPLAFSEPDRSVVVWKNPIGKPDERNNERTLWRHRNGPHDVRGSLAAADLGGLVRMHGSDTEGRPRRPDGGAAL